MATYSQVKAALDTIAESIAKNRLRIILSQETAQEVSDALDLLQTTHADVITTIGTYGTTNASEALAKTDLAKLSAEFTVLKTDADTIAAVNLDD